MPRITLDVTRAEDCRKVEGQWKVEPGLVPGEPNAGLTAQLPSIPARLAEYDDSGWQICSNLRQSVSKGFTFAWYRMTVELPEQINGISVAGYRVWFETHFDNYGEVWIDGRLDRPRGAIIGINAQYRVQASPKAAAGEKHVIACLVANGPLAEPRDGLSMRYATLAFELAG